MTGFHPANFGLRVPFRFLVMLRHATDRETDGQTPRPGDGHNNKWDSAVIS